MRATKSLTRLKLEHRRSHPGWLRFLAVELHLLDAVAAFLDLVERNQNLPDVFVRLVEMRLQLADAIAQPTDVVHQITDLAVDLVGRLAHARIALDLLD